MFKTFKASIETQIESELIKKGEVFNFDPNNHLAAEFITQNISHEIFRFSKEDIIFSTKQKKKYKDYLRLHPFNGGIFADGIKYKLERVHIKGDTKYLIEIDDLKAELKINWYNRKKIEWVHGKKINWTIGQVIVASLALVAFCIVGYLNNRKLINTTDSKKHIKIADKFEIGGIVFVDGKAKEGVTASILELEKSTITNEYGVFKFLLNANDTVLKYSLKFTSNDFGIDSLCIVENHLTNTKYFLNSNAVKSTSKPTTIKSYNINFKGLSELEQLLKKSGFVYSNTNPTYNIQMEFTNPIDQIDNSLYRYSGGIVQLKINGTACVDLDSLIINPTFYGGNNRGNVLSEINEQIILLVKSNKIYVYNKIKQCLK
jgi:hypothetical protein